MALTRSVHISQDHTSATSDQRNPMWPVAVTVAARAQKETRNGTICSADWPLLAPIPTMVWFTVEPNLHKGKVQFAGQLRYYPNQMSTEMWDNSDTHYVDWCNGQVGRRSALIRSDHSSDHSSNHINQIIESIIRSNRITADTKGVPAFGISVPNRSYVVNFPSLCKILAPDRRAMLPIGRW